MFQVHNCSCSDFFMMYVFLMFIFLNSRFSEEEKKGRSPLSWMPFGYGPRNCIGMRLALLEVKIVAAHALYNFKVEPCSKTQVRCFRILINQIKSIEYKQSVKLWYQGRIMNNGCMRQTTRNGPLPLGDQGKY